VNPLKRTQMNLTICCRMDVGTEEMLPGIWRGILVSSAGGMVCCELNPSRLGSHLRSSARRGSVLFTTREVQIDY
jgi:hypothetical protein